MPGGMRPPPSAIASWPPPNRVDPETHGRSATIVCGVFGGIAFITVAMRLWARVVVQRNGGLDDILIALSLVPILGLLVAFPLGSEVYGYNRHTWDNTLAELIIQRKFALINEVFYTVSSGLIKVSVLLFYRRMGFRTVSPAFRTIIWISIVYVIGYSIAFLVVIFLSCRPLSAFWNQINPYWVAKNPYHCYEESTHLLAANAIALTQDLIATTLPAILCWNLKISWRQKLALAMVFLMGYSTAILVGLRTYFIWRVYYATYDASWSTWICWMLAIMEILVAATCSSLPAVRILFFHYGVSSYLASVAGTVHSALTSRSRKRTSVSSATSAADLTRCRDDETKTAHDSTRSASTRSRVSPDASQVQHEMELGTLNGSTIVDGRSRDEREGWV